jgi:hypothetical protein
VSLLQTIPGVDWGRIYTAGLSLGGWQALWTAALDRRVSRVVAAGIFKRLDKMEWQSADDLCQTIPALSTAFLAYGSLPSLLIPQLITQRSMLVTTPDIAALIFGHAALLSTWNMKDSGWGQVGNTLTDTTQAATETGGTYLSEIAPRLLEASIPNSHEFYSFMPTPGKGAVHLDHTLGAIPFLLGAAPTMITSPRAGQTFQPGALVRFSANVWPSHHDPVDVTWVTNHGIIGTGNPLINSLTLGDTLVTAIAKDEATGAVSRAQVSVRVASGEL